MKTSSRGMTKATLICNLACLIAAVFSPGPTCSGAEPTKSVALASLYPGSKSNEDKNATIAFLPKENIAVLLCLGAPFSRVCKLIVLRWPSNRVEVLAATQNPFPAQAPEDLYGLPDGQILVNLHKGHAIFPRDLTEPLRTELTIIGPAKNTNRLGIYEQKSWKVARLIDRTLKQEQEGPGELLSVSDKAVCYRADDKVITVDALNRQLGSFSVPPQSKSGSKAELAGANRLLLDNIENNNTFVTFTGKKILSLKPNSGWGFRHGWSADYSRVSFDTYTRLVPPLQHFGEVLGALITGLAGVGAADESPTGESIRVYDSLTDKTCFALDLKNSMLGTAGSFHADVDPSGRWVAIASRQALEFYPLPNVCSGD